MKKTTFIPALAVILTAFVLSACSPVTMTSWHNPKDAADFKIQTVVIWGMFDKLEYEKPFEEAVADYLSYKKVKAIPALSVLEPKKKYEYNELEEIFNKAGANCALIFTFAGVDKSEDYVPGTTTVYPGYYYNYYNYYNYAWNGYWGGGAVVSTPGYWTTVTTVKLEANLYANANDELVYTANISITDPDDIRSAGYEIAKKIYSDWLRVKKESQK